MAADGLGALVELSPLVPDDPRFDQQWGLQVTETARAWAITTGSTQATAAVLDTGVDYAHPDLYKNIWINQEEIPSLIRAQLIDVDDDGLITFWDLNEPVNLGPGKITDLNGNGYIDGGDVLRPLAQGGWADGLDNGGNGFVDDLVGWDFLDNDNDPMDVDGHGTASAGIIGAVGDNGVGIAGINWQIQIMPVKFFPTGRYQDFTPAELLAAATVAPDAIRYAVDNGSQVSNNSWGAPAQLVPPALVTPIVEAIEYAADGEHLMVFAAGNDANNNDLFPRLPSSLDLPNIISVAATKQNDKLTSYSNFGAVAVDLGAPGKNLWTTSPRSLPGTEYWSVTGTSHAAPFVTGAAALILSVNPSLTYAEVKSRILDSVDPLATLQGKSVTGGRLNIFEAVSATPAPVGIAATSELAIGGISSSFVNLVPDPRTGPTATSQSLRHEAPPIAQPVSQLARNTGPASTAVIDHFFEDDDRLITWLAPLTASTPLDADDFDLVLLNLLT